MPEDLERLGLTAAFDVVFSSHELGVAKPDRAAFAAVTHLAGVAAPSIAFVDDSPVNVEAARTAGWRATRYDGVDALRAWLSALP